LYSRRTPFYRQEDRATRIGGGGESTLVDFVTDRRDRAAYVRQVGRAVRD
jgi:hypothetical protein